MLTFQVTADLSKMKAMLSGFTSSQAPFAIAKALTQTAKDVQDAVRADMPNRFTLRREWIVKGIVITPAKKTNLESVVFSRDAKFMYRQEEGADKLPMYGSNVAIPLDAVRRTKRGMIATKDLPKNIKNTLTPKGGHKGGTLTAVLTTQSSKKYLVRVKPGYKGRKNRLDFLYALRPRAFVKARLGLHTTGVDVATKKFDRNLKDAVFYAMQTAK